MNIFTRDQIFVNCDVANRSRIIQRDIVLHVNVIYQIQESSSIDDYRLNI